MIISNFKNKIKNSTLSPLLRNIFYFFSVFRPKSSYGQIGEDLILDYFLKNKSKGFYVDVGAYHPFYISNTYKFYKKGWTGIQIEPNYKKLALFKKYRPNSINLNIGIGDKVGESDLFIFDSDAYSTFSLDAVETNKKLGHKLLETKRVKMMTLADVFGEHAKNTEIDFMSVDTEGFDL